MIVDHESQHRHLYIHLNTTTSQTTLLSPLFQHPCFNSKYEALCLHGWQWGKSMLNCSLLFHHKTISNYIKLQNSLKILFLFYFSFSCFSWAKTLDMIFVRSRAGPRSRFSSSEATRWQVVSALQTFDFGDSIWFTHLPSGWAGVGFPRSSAVTHKPSN